MRCMYGRCERRSIQSHPALFLFRMYSQLLTHNAFEAGVASSSASNSKNKARSAAPLPQAQTSEASTAVGSFEVLSGDSAPAAAADRHTLLTPLAADEWATFLDVMGRIEDPQALWLRVHRGGVSPGLRKEVSQPTVLCLSNSN
jgi:hypothetical protein